MDWHDVFDLHIRCNNFHTSDKVTTIAEVENILKNPPSTLPCTVLNCEVHQGTSKELVHREAAERFATDTVGDQLVSDPPNDGTNACVFLSLKICECLLNVKDAGMSNDGLKNLVTALFADFTTLVNPVREKERIYEPNSALPIMRRNNLIRKGAELSE